MPDRADLRADLAAVRHRLREVEDETQVVDRARWLDYMRELRREITLLEQALETE